MEGFQNKDFLLLTIFYPKIDMNVKKNFPHQLFATAH